jgi:glyoxylase-like metal-dependent hydrolase (beta-lactamase superfamily II)
MSATDWFEVREMGDGITVIGEPRHDEAVKSFLVEGERDVAVIDTGLGVGDYAGVVRQCSDRDPVVLQTHGHWDHIGATWQFERRLIHPSEAYTLRRGFANALYRPLFSGRRAPTGGFPPGFDLDTAAIPPCEPTGELRHGDTIDLGDRLLEVFHTPGHSPGGVSLLDHQTGALFVGDAANEGGLWLFLPRSDAAVFRATIHLLADLAPRVSAVYASHGDVPTTPASLVEIRDIYEEIWSGLRKPDSHLRWDIGFPEKVPVDVFTHGRYQFLMGTGRYGDAAA